MKQWTPLEKIDQARMNLVREFPFFGSVFFRLNILEDDTCKTAWTDGVSIGYNTTWLGQWSIPQITGVFVHEVLHVILKHMLREELMASNLSNHGKFNRAGDYALNPIIIGTRGLDLPPGCLLDLDRWEDSLAEDIYQQLPDDPDDDKRGKPGEGSGSGSGSGQPGENDTELRPYKDGKASSAEKDTKANEVDAWVNAAGMKASNAGRFGGNEQRIVKDMQNPSVKWEDELQLTVESICKNNYTWTRPNTRYIQGGVYLPSMRGHQTVDMIFFVDTSGSLSERQLEQIMAEVRVIIDHFEIRVIVVYWDTDYRGMEIFDKSDVLEPSWVLNTKGHGGTDFERVLDWLYSSDEDFDLDPKACIFFTDLECSRYPVDSPDMPWIWAHVPNGNGFNTRYLSHMPDWGTTVRVPIFQGG